jgi:hypothetical protein
MAKRGKHPNSKATQFKPGNPGGIINETTQARRRFRTAFDTLVGSDKPFSEAVKTDSKDTPAKRLAKVTLRDAVQGKKGAKGAALRVIVDLFSHRPAQGVYQSDEDGNQAPAEDSTAIAAKLIGLGFTLPPGLTPRTESPKEQA